MSQPAASNPTPRRWGCAAIALALFVISFGVPWVWNTIQRAEWDANSGTVRVSVEGARWGDGYELADTAVIETWAEHEEIAVRLYIARTADKGSSMTPIVAVEISTDRYPIRCETGRSWLWSTEAGSEVTLLCDGYLTLEQIREIEAVRIDLSRG